MYGLGSACTSYYVSYFTWNRARSAQLSCASSRQRKDPVGPVPAKPSRSAELEEKKRGIERDKKKLDLTVSITQ